MIRLVFCLTLLLAVLARAGNIPAAALEEAAAYSARHGGTALLVKQGGKVVFSSGRTEEAHKIYSGTKGFWVLAALAASDEGILKLDERVSETVPEWREDPRRAGITVRDLITFTSGLEPRFDLHGGGFADRNRLALNAAVVGPTGGSFIYGPAALQVFAEVFKRRLAEHGETLPHFLEHKVLRPLGLGPQRYLSDGAGNPLIATGFLLTPAQWSRVGEVILAHGKPVVSGSALEQCFRGTAPNRAFGIGFWNNRNAASAGARESDIEDLLDLKWYQQDWRGLCLCREAPSDLVAAIGSGYQRMYVVPSQDLIVVRFGNGARFPDAEFLRLLFGKQAGG